MKTIIQEGTTANVIYTLNGDDENMVEVNFPVLPKVGDVVSLSRHGGYFSSKHVITKVEHEVRVGDLGNTVTINLYTVPEEV